MRLFFSTALLGLAWFAAVNVLASVAAWIVGRSLTRRDAPAPLWLSLSFINGDAWYQGGEAPYITIKSLAGERRADLGDWIVRGHKGEIFPVASQTFDDEYERSR